MLLVSERQWSMHVARTCLQKMITCNGRSDEGLYIRISIITCMLEKRKYKFKCRYECGCK